MEDSMEILDYFRNAIQEYLEKKPRGAQKILAQQVGLTPIHLNDFLGSRRTLTETDRLKLCAIIGVDYISMLQRGKALTNTKTTSKESLHPIIVQTNSTEKIELIEQKPSKYKGIPLMESGRLSAWSNGAAFDTYENPKSEVIVYLPELGHRAKHNLVAAKVGGDSMEPIIPKDAIVIIDKDDREFVDNKIFAVAVEEGGVQNLAVKYVRKFQEAKGFLLLSENQRYQPRLVTEPDWLRLCVGRVIWMWRSFNG